jgi:5S rRNA maturation endonuclease (ribonuclease M5)
LRAAASSSRTDAPRRRQLQVLLDMDRDGRRVRRETIKGSRISKEQGSKTCRLSKGIRHKLGFNFQNLA